jgi:cytochrome d ubiquinol oxidase subunit II
LYPWTLATPIAALGAAALALVVSRRHASLAFVFSSLAVAGVVLTAGFALFPFVMPSSADPKSSLTVWDSVSSQRTLQIMFWVTVGFLPLIVAYTAWAYRLMRGKITEQHVREGGSALY